MEGRFVGNAGEPQRSPKNSALKKSGCRIKAFPASKFHRVLKVLSIVWVVEPLFITQNSVKSKQQLDQIHTHAMTMESKFTNCTWDCTYVFIHGIVCIYVGMYVSLI